MNFKLFSIDILLNVVSGQLLADSRTDKIENRFAQQQFGWIYFLSLDH